MRVIEAVYEKGVFRPIALVPAELRDGDRVVVAPVDQGPAEAEPPTVRDILARQHRSGFTDTAARHEHQP
jgi:hypothetical protein